MKTKTSLTLAGILLLIVVWLVFFPPRFWLNLTKSVNLTNPALTGERLVIQYDCRSCHKIAGQGALKGPELDGITERLDSVSLRLWLQNPKRIKSDTAMPNFKLSDSEIGAIIAYLETLDP